MFCFRLIQRPALETGIADDGLIHKTQHGSTAQSGLHGIGFAKGIIGRAAFKTNCNVRINTVDGDFNASLSNLFLRRQEADDIERQVLFLRQLLQTNEQSCAANPAVKGLSPEESSTRLIEERDIGDGRLSDADAASLLSFFRTSGADIDDQL